MQIHQKLEQVFDNHGFPLTSKQIEQLVLYSVELRQWNHHINLTAINEDTDVIYKHFLDSVSVLEHCSVKEGHKLVDIGTGAGFPGIVLKIYIPNIQLTLVEASYKKVAFLKYLTSQLGIDSSIQVVAERAEICAETDTYKNAYDWVMTRYVASLAKSVRYCLPLLNETGRWVAYKSKEKDVEIQESESALKEHFGKIESIHDSRIALLNRSYIIIRRLDNRI
ncbi:16S rRNA (guanine(527)-N(7))-methyltransferase RsmG [Candidatus Poribacteria bacterium]|nr:16S rRNA (guanine(527)-N(7))-methyltransferase RsmG [Candidatus Poribacteria bacterium]